MTSAPQADLGLRTHSAPLQPEDLLPDFFPKKLQDGTVEVWFAELGDSNSLDTWESLLAPEEQERAQRFHFAPDLRRYTYGRGLLRWLLGAYLEMDPTDLRFTYSPHGKPDLAFGIAKRQLGFNVSHSGTLLLLAFAWERCVGVDVEQVREDVEVEQIAERFFSHNEREALLSLNEASRIPAFFRCWSRKEAYIKATGKGLSLPLSEFDVSLLPGQPAALLATRPDPREAGRWTLYNLETGSEYAAAVAVERSSTL
jgi:4'-phosphopantetheinyl transferase